MNTRTILLADDSVTIQKVVELTFMEEEIEVVAVGSGEEALGELEEVQPDLVIADVHMPGPDGFEVCRRVKERDPAIPVLLLVGTFEPFNPEDVAACGADGFLKKPFDSQELIQQVEQLMGPAVEPAPVGAQVEPPVASTPDGDTSLSGIFGRPSTDAEREEGAPETAPEERVAADQEPSAVAEPPAPDTASAAPRLSDEDVERIARRVVALAGEKALRDVAWEVVPDLAEVVIKDRLRELESQVD